MRFDSTGSSERSGSPGGYLCFRKGDERQGPGGDELPEQEGRPAASEEEAISCKICRFEITSREHAVEIDGQNEHTFFNPAGILFEIGCFAAAPGCADAGKPTPEFSWFPGFAWHYSFCSACGAHLGWKFQSGEGSVFWGLVLNRLVEGERAAG